MRKQKINDKRLSDKAIELYCQSVEEVLTKIYDKKGGKRVHSDEEVETEERHMAMQD